MFVENPLTSSEYSFPVLEIFHIVGFTVGIGTASLLDFRLLGFGLTRQTSADLVRDLQSWTILGLTLAILSGAMLYSTDPDKYYLNWSFLIKIACLLLAIAFQFTILRRVARAGITSGTSTLVACVSLVLWASVVFGGGGAELSASLIHHLAAKHRPLRSSARGHLRISNLLSAASGVHRDVRRDDFYDGPAPVGRGSAK